MKRLLFLIALVLCVSAAEGRNRKTKDAEKPQREKPVKPPKVKQQTVYIFGYAFSMLDSVAYITPVQCLDSVFIDSRTGFLIDRPMYSMQYQVYLEDSLSQKNMTATVMFHKKKGSAEKKYAKVMKRTKADPSLRLTVLDAGAFKFYAERWIVTAGNEKDDVSDADTNSDSTKKGGKRKAEKAAKKE